MKRRAFIAAIAAALAAAVALARYTVGQLLEMTEAQNERLSEVDAGLTEANEAWLLVQEGTLPDCQAQVQRMEELKDSCEANEIQLKSSYSSAKAELDNKVNAKIKRVPDEGPSPLVPGDCSTIEEALQTKIEPAPSGATEGLVKKADIIGAYLFKDSEGAWTVASSGERMACNGCEYSGGYDSDPPLEATINCHHHARGDEEHARLARVVSLIDRAKQAQVIYSSNFGDTIPE